MKMKLPNPFQPRTKSSRAVQSDVLPHQIHWGTGQDWRPTTYGEYFTKSVPVYSAVRIRADALARVPWTLTRSTPQGRQLLPDNHPLVQQLNQPNPWYSGSDLRRATETNLCLWGTAFWTLEANGAEIWPIRPDRMRVLPEARGPRHIRGYIYEGINGEVAYLPEEVEFFRLFNPLQEHTGLSPLAPLRLSADMGQDALKYNRNTFRNGAMPDYVLLADEMLTDAQAEEFYRRWEKRFQGPDRAHRPAIASSIRDIKTMAFSQREMEFTEGLRWSIKDASRIYGVPETLLSELQFATLSNIETLERTFWRNTIIPEAIMIQERITTSLLPKLGYHGYQLEFDFSGIEALSEGEEQRLKRETEYLDRGVLTINEVRQARNLDPVTWGNVPTPRAPTTPPNNPPTPHPQPATNGRQ